MYGCSNQIKTTHQRRYGKVIAGYIERALYMSDDISSLIMRRLLFILFLYSLRIIEDLQNRVADDLYHDDAIILIP